MRTWFLTAPRWAVSLASGLAFGVCFVLLTRFVPPSGSWRAAVVSGVVVGVVFGVASMIAVTSHRREIQEAAGDLSPAQLAAAYEAAQRTSIPDDPQVRAAAARIVALRVKSARRSWVVSALVVIPTAAGAAMSLYGADYRLGVLLATVSLVNAVEAYRRRRLGRHVRILAD